MRTVINGENVYCAGSGTPVLGSGLYERRECPVCGDRVLVTRLEELRQHFAPYRVGSNGLRLPGPLL